MCVKLVQGIFFTALAFLFAKFASGFMPPSDGDYRHLYPSVCVCVRVVDGYDHTIPYVLGHVENWRYPKDRIRLRFFTVSNETETDEATQAVKSWITAMTRLGIYKSIDEQSLLLPPTAGNGELASADWHEEALRFGRQSICHYLFMMTTVDFISERALKQLIDFGEVVVSPLLHSPLSSGLHSSVHGLLGLDFVFREKPELIRVYYSHGSLLVHLKHPDAAYLTFDEANLNEGTRLKLKAGHSTDPVQVFAASAFAMDVPIRMSNHHFYGHTLTVGARPWPNRRTHQQMMCAMLARMVSDRGPLTYPVSTVLPAWYPPATRHGFDKIFLINLRRRPERLSKMAEVLRLIGLDYTRFEAVDGKNLSRADTTPEDLHFLPDYRDPYHGRAMTLGELGCFLSHYRIWETVVREGLGRVLVFEDDIRFSENGTIVLDAVVEDLMRKPVDWDFVYLGRKKMSPPGDEFYVEDHRYLSTVGYSYWTLGYALTHSGAQKLVGARPLDRLLALDEFLPIMYGQHPNPKWTSAFAGGGGAGTLRAFAVYPAVVEPERYTNQPGYVSDTEQSSVAAVGLDLEGGKSGGGNGGDTETEEALNLDENVAVEAESVAAAQRFFSASSSSHDEEL